MSVDKVIHKLCETISHKYDIEIDELISIWDNFNIEKKSDKFDKSKKKSDKKSDKSNKSDKKSEKSQNIEEDGCPYRLSKGKNAGKNCGAKSKNGNLYCSAHKKYENVEQKQKKVIPVSSRTELAAKIEKPSRTVSREEKCTFYKDKVTGLYVNSNTNFVVESVKDKIVIGKMINKKISPLTDEDREQCKKLSFKYKDEKEDDKDEDKEDDKDEDQDEDKEDDKDEDKDEVKDENEDIEHIYKKQKNIVKKSLGI
jgi:hypothetical protein